MCGIVGYIGEKPTKDFIIDGLKKLEYRGYDSAGAFLFNSKGYLRKCKGKAGWRIRSSREIFPYYF